jgi:hypothetical protein
MDREPEGGSPAIERFSNCYTPKPQSFFSGLMASDKNRKGVVA